MKNLRENWKKDPFKKNIFWIFIVSGGFIGFIPPFPGTLGALEGLFIFLIFKNTSILTQSLILIPLILLGIIGSRRIIKIFKERDPEFVVIDEIAGMFISLIGKKEWWELAGAFLLFRLLDITKPFFIKDLEEIPEGVGVLADDLVAGILTNLILLSFKWSYLKLL